MISAWAIILFSFDQEKIKAAKERMQYERKNNSNNWSQ